MKTEVMDKRSKFSSLSPEDQQKTFSRKHTYEQMVEIIGKPRPEGLALKTSVTALCRFNVHNNPALPRSKSIANSPTHCKFAARLVF